ncbi:MAG: phosphatase PAP2 family protein [Clostridia bacterium]|nr:phosphatase PAP2 family protein [Clostridia bacterium]
MSKIKDYVKTHPQIWLLIYWPIHAVWYSLLQQTTMGRDPLPIVCSLDYKIPFCEWFVIPYALWYVQLALMGIYTFIKRPCKFFRFSIMVAGGACVCMIICTFIPMYFNRVGMEAFPRDNLLVEAVKLIRGIDPPTTVLPSMHVYVSVALHICLCKDEKLASRKVLKYASLVLSILITASTVLLKQHSIIDVFAAFVLLPIMYFLAYVVKYPRLSKFFGDK